MKTIQKSRPRSHTTGAGSSSNKLTLSYESHGPNVKIQGTARHVADKYLQLARDAHTGDNPVQAENYLQHAEHYFRLIAAAQPGSGAMAETDPDDLETENVDRGLPDRFTSPGAPARQTFAEQTGVWPRKAG